MKDKRLELKTQVKLNPPKAKQNKQTDKMKWERDPQLAFRENNRKMTILLAEWYTKYTPEEWNGEKQNILHR